MIDICAGDRGSSINKVGHFVALLHHSVLFNDADELVLKERNVKLIHPQFLVELFIK